MLVDVLASSILPVDLANRVANVLKAIIGPLPEDAKASLWNSIAPEKIKALQVKFLQSV